MADRRINRLTLFSNFFLFLFAFIFSFWPADPKGTMSYRTEGGISVRPSERTNERASERPGVPGKALALDAK